MIEDVLQEILISIHNSRHTYLPQNLFIRGCMQLQKHISKSIIKNP